MGMRWFWYLGFASGCTLGTPSPFGGDDLGFGGDDLGSDVTFEATGVTVAAADGSTGSARFDGAADMDDDAEPAEQMDCVDSTAVPQATLTAEAVEGGLAVLHDNAWLATCGSYQVMGTIEGNTIYVEYTNADAEACDCFATFDLTYGLGPLPSGEWTVVANDMAATATVE